MKKRIGLLFYIVVSLMLLAGCAFEQRSSCIEQGEVNVDIEFQVSQLEMPTRAKEMGDLEDEVTVSHLTLFAEQGATWKRFDFDYSAAPLKAGLFASRITLDAGTYNFYAVANAPKALLEAVGSKTDLYDLIHSSVDMPKAPYIMTGAIENISISATEKVPIRLERIVAKIDVINESTDFVFSGVALYNVPSSTYLFPHIDSNKDRWTILPSPLTRVSYTTEVVAQSNAVKDALYCFESFNKDAQTTSDNVSLVIKGSYLGQEGFYRVDIRDFRGRQWVRRNTRYQITIKNVTGFGYSTAGEAMKNKPTNMVLGLATRSDEDITSEYMVFDGEYFLGSSVDKVEANFDGTKDETYGESQVQEGFLPTYKVRIVTNTPSKEWSFTTEGEVLDQYTHYSFLEDPNKPTSWPTLTDYQWLFVEKDTSDPNLLLLDVYSLYGVDELDLFPENREAFVNIQADGRPNLRLKLPVIQYNLPSFYERLEADPDLHISNGKQVDVFVSNVGTMFPFTEWRVDEILSSTGEASWVSVQPGIGEAVIGANQMRIEVQPLPPSVFYREAYIILKTTPGIPGNPAYTKVVRIISGLDLTYDIVYPIGTKYYNDLSRTTRVIETPLNQEAPYTYTVNVRSTQKWKVQASHPWIKVSQPTFVSGSYNTSFTVEVPVNPGNGTDYGGLKKAREGYVDILGDQMHQRIMVYQGGYVQIGNDIWMDRNLMLSRFYGRFPPLSRYIEEPPTIPRDVADILYPAAVPIAFPGNITACYGKHRSATSATHPGGKRTINGYDAKGKGYQYSVRENPIQDSDDGYFAWGQPYPMLFTLSAPNNVNASCWNSNYKSTTVEILDEVSKKGLTDPCPDGWRIPSYRELSNLSSYLNKGVRKYYSGFEDISGTRKDDDLNNGLFFYNADKVSCWFPFAGYRMSMILERKNGQLTNQGKETRYYTNLNPDRINPFYLGLTPNGSDIEQSDMCWGYPIRCIRDKDN